MTRDALIRALRRYARRRGLALAVDRQRGKGSHFRVRLGEAVTTIQSGDLSPFHVDRICRQLKVAVSDL
ncbi:hypothetical protein FV228_08865 [Methylobacterium sp. WL18]|nr:hypothetical protein FV233_05290 [Methylobacterium sp. WL7]TXN73003.1 hypothetical protein FV228_08865 [Methylobacterium sp. WL18]